MYLNELERRRVAALAANPARVPYRHGSAWGECRYRLKGLLADFGRLDADLTRRISFETKHARSKVLLQGFEYLHSQGIKIRNPANFRPKHMAMLVAHWEEQGLSASTLQQRFSIFATFCVWIGKKGMLGGIERYLKDPARAQRTYVATEDKSWVAKGVQTIEKIAQVAGDPRPAARYVAVQLLVQWAFMLRAREAWQIHPDLADKHTYLAISHGTKGGRERTVTVRNDWQRQVLEIAKSYADPRTGSLIPATYSRKSWSSVFYRICRDHGISRADGITPHGLRHEAANDLYEELTGTDSPVRAAGVRKIAWIIDDIARRTVSEELGHSRKAIAGAYFGPVPPRPSGQEQGASKGA